METERISKVSLRLSVGGSRLVFLSLAADGRIRRAGRGDEEILGGTAEPNPFPALLRAMTPEFLQWAGQSWSDPRPRGRACRLAIGLRERDGNESLLVWEYGSESPEPPLAIRAFILAAVEATDPWYVRQRALARPARAGWHLLPA